MNVNECNCNTFTFIKSCFIAPSVQNTKMENVHRFHHFLLMLAV